MNYRIVFFSFIFISFISKAQTTTISPLDSLSNQVVLYIPTATSAQLTGLQAEFVSKPQISSAIFVFQTHNCLLIDLATLNTPGYIYYSDIVKLVSQYLNPSDIHIKTPEAYPQIMAATNSSSFILK